MGQSTVLIIVTIITCFLSTHLAAASPPDSGYLDDDRNYKNDPVRRHTHSDYEPYSGHLKNHVKGQVEDSKIKTHSKTRPEPEKPDRFASPSERHGVTPDTHKKSFGIGLDEEEPYTEPGWELGHLVKLKLGAIAVALLLGVAAVTLVFPGVLSGFPSHGGIVVPGFINQLMPGLGLDGHSNYDSYVGQDYSGYTSYNGIYKSDAGRKRSLGRNHTNSFVSTIQKSVQHYWGQAKMCAEHALCIRGRELVLKDNSTDGTTGTPKNKTLEEGLNSFEHILEAMTGMEGISRRMPIFHELYKAFKSGQERAECAKLYKVCPFPTAAHISKTVKNMGDFIFN